MNLKLKLDIGNFEHDTRRDILSLNENFTNTKCFFFSNFASLYKETQSIYIEILLDLKSFEVHRFEDKILESGQYMTAHS